MKPRTVAHQRSVPLPPERLSTQKHWPVDEALRSFSVGLPLPPGSPFSVNRPSPHSSSFLHAFHQSPAPTLHGASLHFPYPITFSSHSDFG